MPDHKLKPHEVIEKCFYDWNRKLLIAVGHDLFLEPFAPNAFGYFLYLLLFTFVAASFYTIMNYDLLTVLTVITDLCVGSEVSILT